METNINEEELHGARVKSACTQVSSPFKGLTLGAAAIVMHLVTGSAVSELLASQTITDGKAMTYESFAKDVEDLLKTGRQYFTRIRPASELKENTKD